MELAVKYSEWPPANWLHRQAKVGDRVSVRVGGDFHYPDKDTEAVPGHDLLLVAGGVGINPLASIIFHLAGNTSAWSVLYEMLCCIICRARRSLVFVSKSAFVIFG